MGTLPWVIEGVLAFAVLAHYLYGVTLQRVHRPRRQRLAWHAVTLTWFLFAATLGAWILQLHHVHLLN